MKTPTALEIRVAKALYKLGATQAKMAELIGTHRRRVPRILVAAGLEPRKRGWLSDSGRRSRIAAGRARRGKPVSPDRRAKISATKLAQGDKTARGIKMHDGYLVYTRGPNRDRGVHRVLMEKRLGRKLRRDEHVHHVDGNRANNTFSNLRVMTNAEHAALHGELQKWRQKA